MDDNLKEYRAHLVLAEQKAQEDFDKSVLSLSGGALGVSFAFIKDVAGTGPFLRSEYLICAWICWGTSVTVVLLSYFLSHLALRRAIAQVDKGQIYKGRPGEYFDIATAVCNAVGGLLFFSGVILLTVFVAANFRR